MSSTLFPLGTVLQDLVFSLFFGALAAWLVPQGELSPSRPLSGNAARRFGLFLLVVWAPVTLYFALAHPQWSWWYMLTSDQMTLWHLVLPLPVELALGIAGWVLVAHPRSERRMAIALGSLGLAGCLATLLRSCRSST